MKNSLSEFKALHNLTNLQIAEITGLNPQHISRCLNGQRNLSLNAWRVLRLQVEKEIPRKGL